MVFDSIWCCWVLLKVCDWIALTMNILAKGGTDSYHKLNLTKLSKFNNISEMEYTDGIHMEYAFSLYHHISITLNGILDNKIN